MSFFASPDVLLQQGDDLTAIDYLRPSNHLLPESVYVGSDTTALLLHFTDEGQQTEPFYRAVTTQHLSKKITISSHLFGTFSHSLTPSKHTLIIGLFDDIEREIPIAFDKSQVKLE